MPQQNHELQTFEYHFKFFQLYHNYFSFISLGWENWKYPQKYSIDNFGSSENQFIFQYTVSGEGAITINSHTHVLRPGQAFLIERPGATHYFRPKNSAHWELQFLSMNAVCGSILRNIINEYGNIYTLPPACPVLNCWEKLYGLAVNKQIDNFFTASSYTYEFIMALHDTLRALPGLRHFNNRLQNCVEAIQANYQSNLTLTQMAQICNLSPSYLTKIFKENFKTTPVQYLIKYRIEMDCRLLQRSDMRIEDIALQTGFGSGNYFSRIFKSVVGVSPKDYRKEQNLELLTAQETQELIVRYEMLK